jgi:hypothetical protein
MNFIILALVMLSGISAFAQNSGSRRAADLEEGTQVMINLADADLLKDFEKKWQVLASDAKRKCSLTIKSHFDQNLALRSGLTAYKLKQNNPNNWAEEHSIRDQSTLWFSNDNPDLPLLVLDCFMEAPNATNVPGGLTLGYIETILGQPGFFAKPVFKNYDSKMAADFFPPIKKVRILKALQLGETPPNEKGYTYLKQPRFMDGKIVTEGPAFCSALHHAESSGKGYDLTLQPGEEFTLRYSSSLDARLYTLTFWAKNFTQLTFECFDEEGISSFDFFKKHMNSIVEFLP